MDIYIKISSGQFVMYADLDLSEEVSARNVYLHVCLCSEEKKLERKEKEEGVIFSETKRG